MMASAERDVSNVVMIPHNYDNHDNNAALQTSTRTNHSWSANFPLPISLFEDLPSVSESNGIGSHPLLLGSGGSLDIANSRAQRALRQRRYQYLQIGNPRNSNSPVILQRLLVPAAQTLPMSASQVLASGFRDTRVVVMDNTLGIFSNQEEEQIDFVDQSGYLFGPSLAATLNNIPTALHWWIEESKLLDGDSQPDCCVGVVHKLIPKLEKQRNAELAERKDKRKKQQNTEKDTEKDSKDAKDSSKTREAGSSVIVTSQAEQQQPSGSVLIRANSRRLADTVEAAVEAVGENTNREDNVIEITGEMEVTVQDDEERTPPPPPPPPEEQIPDTRNPLTILNAPLELAESLIDSVFQPSTEEATRLRRLNSNRDQDEINLNRSYNLLPESRDPDAWVQRLLGIDQSRRENNANISIQDPSSSSSTSDNIITFTEQCEPQPTLEQQQQPTLEQQQQQQQSSQSQIATQQTPVNQTTSPEALPQSSESQETPTEQQPTQQPGQSQAQAQQQSSQELQLPDGVDPSFLAALPDEMRDEVIAEQLRLQRIRQRTQATVVEEVTGPIEVNPEFLAALPPAIQEEVLAQQRLEQQRHAAASANPADPVDAAAFFQNLQPSLRQAILTDMEESQMSVLPPDLAEEAQNLRRQWEARNRHLMQERFLNHVSQGSTALSSILRNSGRGRGGGTRYAIHSVTQRAQWNSWNPRGETSIAHQSAGLRLRGRQLLDHESMACLLVLLFVDEPKINTLRLHRVIRNLCYHTNTREWVVKALLNIMERSNDENKEIMSDFTGKFKRKTTHSSIDYCSPKSDSRNNLQSWLNISIDAALGCRANVFHILRHTGKKSERIGSTIAIHPQAAPTVCRHTLELLISLAKSFPGYFVPTKFKESEDKSKEKECSGKEETGAKPKSASKSIKSDIPDFWDMLLKLDCSVSKKGKSVARGHLTSGFGSESEQSLTSFESSAFGQLISMLHWSVVRRSSQLTDKLLRLLSLISIGLTEVNSYRRQDAAKNKKVEPSKEQSVAAPEGHLRLAVQVLTSKSCSEEGLEDATALLLNLSHCPDPTRQLILKLLLEGAMELANMVCDHISELMKELKVLNLEIRRRNSLEDQPSTSASVSGRGNLTDRFTQDSVVITAPSKVKAGTDLQLPSMSALVSKTSNNLWETLSACLLELEHTPDHHAVLVLQPAVEAFFLVHSSSSTSTRDRNNETNAEPREAIADIAPVSPSYNENEGQSQNETANTIAAWDMTPAPPKSLPSDQLKFLKFAETHRTVLNQILRQTTTHLADGPFSVLVDHTRVLDFDVKRRYFRTELERMDEGIRREELAVHVRRSHVFEDSFRELHRRNADEWKNRFYIVFEGEEGQDAGGLLREWYVIISREIFNPMYALFTVSPGDRVTYMINSSSHCNPNHLCYYKFVGRVIEDTKLDYIRLVCQMKMTGAIRKQLNSFLEGFYDIIPKRLISIFNEQELELLISGLPNVDIEDLRANTEYHKYSVTSLQLQSIRLTCV
ncbi:hypothetical protein G9C98_003214 [Cotesia typhae]|uniref:HECT-type E3 ubiquitin transferase n=1 Tax=Cotesia typhae TaxID=2053667 RepID=A0A8J5QYP8_9HYME|nr:hypothetical protein G9C98_003214 [Cotesia typhae]